MFKKTDRRTSGQGVEATIRLIVQEAKSRGGTAWKAGDVDGAISWFSKAIELDSDNGDGQLHVHYSNRSAAYLKKNDASAALADAEKCVELNPSWAKGYSRMGTALYRLGRHAPAAEAYSKGLEREPGNVELRRNLLEAQRQHVSTEAAENRSSRPRETLSAYVRSHPSLTIQFALRAFLVVNWLIYMLPLGEARGVTAYKRLLLCTIAVNVLGMWGRHGRPRFNAAYFTGLVLDPATQSLMTVTLFLVTRPYLIGIMPIVLLELTDFLWFLSGLLSLCPGVLFDRLNRGVDTFGGAIFGIPNWSSRSVTDRWSAAKNKASEWSAWIEVMFGMILIVELILPRRNFIMLALYWQVLRMKYMLNDTTGRGYTKMLMEAMRLTCTLGQESDGGVVEFVQFFQAAFRALDARINVLTAKRRCPKIVGVMYGRLKELLARMVAPPSPEASRPSSSCSIM